MIIYPEDFKNECKVMFPKYLKLHKYLKEGNVKAGYLLKKKLVEKKLKMEALSVETNKIFNLYLKNCVITKDGG